MFNMTLLLIKENSYAKLFWNPCINVEEMAQTSSIYDSFTIWVSSVTLTLDLLEQFSHDTSTHQENNRAKIFRNTCINIEVICRQVYLWKFHYWPSSVTFTFNITERIFYMTLVLINKNDCAELLWHPCINLPQFMEILSFDLLLWPWPLTSLNNSFRQHFCSLRRTIVPHYIKIHP